MTRLHPPVCITCGLSAGTPPALNHLPNGGVCPTCRDRLLDWLPPALPSRPRPEPESSAGEGSADPERFDLRDEGR